MLQKIREKITGWVAGIILALLSFVFAVWGIDIGFSNQSVAAVVNGDKIPVGPVRQAVQNQMAQFQQAYGTEVPELIENQVTESVVESFVTNRLLLQRIREEGYRVSDAALTESITEIPAFQVDGQFSIDAYRAMLANVGYSPTLFEAEQRQNMEIAQLQEGILDSAFATPEELDRRIRVTRERREVAWLILPAERFLQQVEISDEAVAAEYQAHPDRYMNPESVDLEYVEIRLDDIIPEVTVTEQDLREFYDIEFSRDPQMFSVPEQRRARHILVAIDDDTDEGEALEEAQVLAERVKGGEDFAAVAREASDDSGSAELGGDLDWVEQGMMVAPFEEALFSMEEGEISDPVLSPFGYHVIKLEEIRSGDVRTYEQARADLEIEYRNRKAEDLYYDRAERLAELAFESPDSLLPAAEELDLEIKRIDRLGRSGGEGLAADSQVISAAFSEPVMADGENSEPIELEDGHAVVLRVDAHHDAAPRPLDEVRDEIRARLQREAALERSAELGAQVVERLEAGEAPETVARSVDAEFSAAREIGRDSGDLPPALRQAAFDAPFEGGTRVGGVSLADGSYGAWILSNVIPGDPGALTAEEREQIRQQLAQASAGADLNGYVGELRQSATVVINREQFE
jgi:peptidyl-prolyl cis-trans isomerase D